MSSIAVILIIISTLLAVGAVVASFFSCRWAAAVGWLSLCPLCLIDGFAIPGPLLAFWGVAALIALGISYMLPTAVATSRVGVPYMTVGALCGILIGAIAASQAGMICGAVAGILFGGVAYSRTPRGRDLDFPSAQFFNYLLAKGLPMAVALCSAALSALAIYQFFTLNPLTPLSPQ